MVAQISLDREFVQRISKIWNLFHGRYEAGERLGLDLDEIQEIDEKLHKELSKPI